MDSDSLLIQKVKMGSEQAIDLFVRKYYPSILKYCHLHIRDDGDAEEMALETFVNNPASMSQLSGARKP